MFQNDQLQISGFTMWNQLSLHNYKLYNDGGGCLEFHPCHYMARITISGCSGELHDWPFQMIAVYDWAAQYRTHLATLELVSEFQKNQFQGQLLKIIKHCYDTSNFVILKVIIEWATTPGTYSWTANIW